MNRLAKTQQNNVEPKPPTLPAGEGLQAVVDRAALSQGLKDVLPVVNRAATLNRNVGLEFTTSTHPAAPATPINYPPEATAPSSASWCLPHTWYVAA